MHEAELNSSTASLKQLSTFYLSDRLFGIDALQVQEITKALPLTSVPLAPQHVRGLINLRGQISTAIGLRELFKLEGERSNDPMNVVCSWESTLLSFVVDRVGDVLEVSQENFERTPDTLQPQIRKFITGVYKLNGEILSVLDVKSIWNAINS